MGRTTWRAARQRTDTRSDVELTVVWGFIGIRTFGLVQAIVAAGTGSLVQSTNSGLDAAMLMLVLVESILLGAWLVRRRSMLPVRWPFGLDLALGLVALDSTLAYLPSEARLGVAMWSFPLTLSTTVLIGGSLGKWRHVLACSSVLALTYLAVVAFPLTGNPQGQATAVANAMAYPGFASVAYLFFRFVRRLADTADQAKTRVVELERERCRARVHDLLPYLRWDRFAGADEQTRSAMIAQAHATYQQMRSYVDGKQEARDLTTCLHSTIERHVGLLACTVLDIERDVELADDVLDQLHHALDTTLANVEQHAAGAAVVVSARSTHEHVEVVVHDSGPGFDPALARPGFGIEAILGRQLAAVGGVGVVSSAPGHGTEVRITVPRRAS